MGAGRHQEAVASLLEGGNKNPEPLTLLTAAQILLAAGQVKKATETLSQLPPSWKFRTGPLSTLVTLHLAQDQRQATALLLKEAVEWNKSSGVEGAGWPLFGGKLQSSTLKLERPRLQLSLWRSCRGWSLLLPPWLSWSLHMPSVI